MNSRTRRWLRLVITLAGALTIAIPAFGAEILIPVRWCAVKGSNAVDNPVCSGLGPTTALKDILWRRMERPGAIPYGPDCGINFRSGATSSSSIFPIIDDPCDDPADGCVGEPGDIVYDVSDPFNPDISEYQDVVHACMDAWNTSGSGWLGVIGVNVRRLVDSAGVPLPNRLVTGGVPPYLDCAAAASSSAAFAVSDADFIDTVSLSSDPCEPIVIDDIFDTITSHGLGHALSLSFPHTSYPSLMEGGIGPYTTTLTAGGQGMSADSCPTTPVPMPAASQCEQLRYHALCCVPGIDTTAPRPPGLPADGISVDRRPYPIGDTSPSYVDLALIGLVDDPVANKATFFWETAGLFPGFEQDIEYGFAADLDENATTGGDPVALIGIPLAGADIIGQVKVDVQQIGEVKLITTTQKMWTYESVSGSFVEQPALGSSARETRISADPGAPLESVPFTGFVSLDFDPALLAPPVPPASRTGHQGGGHLDVRALARQNPTMPAGGVDLSGVTQLVLETPALATCSVSPSAVNAGDTVTVTASGITTVSEPYHVILGFEEVAAGTTAANGDVSIAFSVGSTPGTRLISVGVDDPLNAVTADCVVQVTSAGTPGEASKLGDMLVSGYNPGSGEVTAHYTPACGSTDHAAHSGSIQTVASLAWDATHCGLGTNGTAVFDPGAGSRYFVVVGDDGSSEGSYGRRSSGLERPEAATGAVCDVPQDLSAPCP